MMRVRGPRFCSEIGRMIRSASLLRMPLEGSMAFITVVARDVELPARGVGPVEIVMGTPPESEMPPDEAGAVKTWRRVSTLGGTVMVCSTAVMLFQACDTITVVASVE